MEKYACLIDHLVHAAEEAAKLTNNQWDDVAAKAARTLFEKFFDCPHTDEVVVKMQARPEVGAIPAWVLPLVLSLIEALSKIDWKK